jgi:hypothetical protein
MAAGVTVQKEKELPEVCCILSVELGLSME